ncbi:amidohydrolase-domain-containing protein [Ephemerocybe angulata]|uniref:Amidohydrolase-domain-containing protein n=1 Tax=Ephemerocybe angulata TaxID=980116 RepID=A0A8H6HPJ7_9AGAR|nr:amidohydrolase-domain-containing protein [Tulosesus angulatus]
MSDPVSSTSYPNLQRTVFGLPAIDNHAHPILKEAHRDAFPFEGLVSEAQGTALTDDSIHTVANLRATKELSKLYGLDENTTWEQVKEHRKTIPYPQLIETCFQPSKLQCLLLDDGLSGVDELAEPYTAHDPFSTSPTKRIVRIEVVAEREADRGARHSHKNPNFTGDSQGLMQTVLTPHLGTDTLDVAPILSQFHDSLYYALEDEARHADVVAFKSVICYRTGLDITTFISQASLKFSILEIFKTYQAGGKIRLCYKALNDMVVQVALEVAASHNIPVQFHTGLGDSDLTLLLSSPARMQAIIKAYPGTKFVLLHSSYPYTREAGYLTSVYPNVFLDFGEVFPMVSQRGQEAILRQIFELCPTNKVMWSSDGHWWPESFYLGSLQARRVLFKVTKEMIDDGDITEDQAIGIVKKLLFENANNLYRLGLTSDFE